MPPRQPGRTVAKPCSSGCACGGCNSDGRPDSLSVTFSGLTGLLTGLNGTWTIPFVQDNGGDCFYDLPSTGTSPDFAIPVDIICAAGSCTLQVILFGASPHVEEYRFTCTLGDAGKTKCKGMNASPAYDSSHGAHDYGDQSAATCTVTSASAPGKMCCCGGQPPSNCSDCCGSTTTNWDLDLSTVSSTSYLSAFCSPCSTDAECSAASALFTLSNGPGNPCYWSYVVPLCEFHSLIIQLFAEVDGGDPTKCVWNLTFSDQGSGCNGAKHYQGIIAKGDCTSSITLSLVGESPGPPLAGMSCQIDFPESLTVTPA